MNQDNRSTNMKSGKQKQAKIAPATEARKEFFNIIRDVAQGSGLYVITLDGKPQAAIAPLDDYDLQYTTKRGGRIKRNQVACETLKSNQVPKKWRKK